MSPESYSAPVEGSSREAYKRLSDAEEDFYKALRPAAEGAGKNYAEIRDAVGIGVTTAGGEMPPEAHEALAELLRGNPELRNTYDALLAAKKEYHGQ